MLFVLWDDWHKRRLQLLGEGIKVEAVDQLDELVEDDPQPAAAADTGSPVDRLDRVAAFAAMAGGEVIVDG